MGLLSILTFSWWYQHLAKS